MKIVLLMAILVFSSLLEASYLRTIHIGSYRDAQTAQQGLEKLQKFALKHHKLIALEHIGNFKFRARKSGRYYITCIEPLRDRNILQEVLDIVRIQYPDAYVTKLKNYKKEVKKQKVEQTTYQYKVVKKPETVHKNFPKYHEKNSEKNTTKTTTQEAVSSGGYLYEILFFITLLILLTLIGLGVYYRKRFLSFEMQEAIDFQKHEQAKEEISQREHLISYVSHELRTPMNAIIGLTDLLLESDLSKVQRDYLENIEVSSNYMLNLLNDILDLSKIQADKLTIEKAEFNINDILNYVYNVIAIQAKHNNLNIILNIEPDVSSHIIGDSLRLGQILINLLSNAVKFTKDGEITLHVKKIESIADEDKVILEFTIADTGIGMTQEQLKRLFASYYQADDSISRKFGGTGLGLAISKKLIELMDGDIDVQSQKGLGTTFTFTLPFSLKDADNKRQYRLPSAKLLNKSVLLIDSQNKNAIPVMQALSYFKYKTHNIVSFEKSNIDLEEDKFDIVIINLQSLNKHAIKSLKHMKKYNPTMKVVILSDLHSNLNDSLLDALVIDGYLKTPIIIQSVLNLITDLYVEKQSVVIRQKQTLLEQLADFKDKKILVVEDNELNHKVIAGMMAKTGIEVNFVHDGQMALEVLRNGTHIDLILMDINMPVMNGYEAVIEIRKSKEFDNIAILALSADVSAEAIRKSFKSGMQGHIAKPVSAAELYSKLLELFRAKSIKIMRVDEDNIPEVNTQENEILDVVMGLDKCDNDVTIYQGMIKEFHEMYGDVIEKLYDLCEHDECKKARYLMMDIKDIAVNIGAYKLAEYCTTMENLLESDDIAGAESYKKHIEEFKTLLEKVFIAIDKYLESSH